MDIQLKYNIAEATLRIFCGVLFLYQGYDKLFNIKIKGVVETFVSSSKKTKIPVQLLTAITTYTSITEFIGGALLILGLFKSYALAFLGLDLILVAVAFSTLEPMWDMRHVFPRLAMVVTLLILPDNFEKFSLDKILNLSY